MQHFPFDVLHFVLLCWHVACFRFGGIVAQHFLICDVLHVLELTGLSFHFFIFLPYFVNMSNAFLLLKNLFSFFWRVECWRVARFRFGCFVVTAISLSAHSTLSDAQVRVRYEGCSQRSRKNVWRCNYQNEPPKLPYMWCLLTWLCFLSEKYPTILCVMVVNIIIIYH